MNDMLEYQLSELNPLLLMKGQLTSLEQDILALLITKVDDNKSRLIYQLSIHEFKSMTNSNDKNIYANVVKAVKRMWRREGFDIYIDGNEVSLQVISSVVHLKKKGIIEIEISSKIKPYLYALKEYFYDTRKGLSYLYSIKGKNSKKIYEFCYLLNARYGLTFIDISCDRLKSILGLAPDSYQQFKDFERRILKEAVDEISTDGSNMLFSYEKSNNNKKGVPVESVVLRFKITNTIDDDPVYLNNKSYIYERMDSFVSWGYLKFNRKEQFHIYVEVSKKKNLEYNADAIIKHINTAINLFIGRNQHPGVEEFIKEI